MQVFGLKIRTVWVRVPPPLLEKVAGLQENQETKWTPGMMARVRQGALPLQRPVVDTRPEERKATISAASYPATRSVGEKRVSTPPFWVSCFMWLAAQSAMVWMVSVGL